MLLKLEGESSIHILQLCSDSGGHPSSWQDIRLLSSKSSGGGEMYKTVCLFGVDCGGGCCGCWAVLLVNWLSLTPRLLTPMAEEQLSTCIALLSVTEVE